MSKTIKIGGRIESAEQGGVVTGANAILDDTKGKKQNVINSETDAELARLDSAKQDVLTFDNAPTEGSNNPVKSGGVYAADAVLQQAIEAIQQLIPSAATALNQLADKAFVNSTVATNTATFRGTYNVVTDLSLHYNSTHQEIATALLSVVQTADNNDYCFVQIPVSDSSGDIRVTERYKFNGTAWSYEYDLNNSGFTADQWAAINSTITLALVQKLGALPTAAELAQQLALKQNTLTFDTAPVAGSSNPVTSGGLYNVIAAINATIPSGASVDNKLVAESRLTQYVAAIVNALDATFNVTSTDGHVNVRLTQVDGVITSVEVITNDIASASSLNTLAGRVTTNEGDIAQLQALYNALQQSAPVIIQPTDTWPVASPSATVIYRVIDRVNTPPQIYSDYMFSANDLTTPVLMAQYNNAIDDVPTAGSQNLVKSGGVMNLAAVLATNGAPLSYISTIYGKYAGNSGNLVSFEYGKTYVYSLENVQYLLLRWGSSSVNINYGVLFSNEPTFNNITSFKAPYTVTEGSIIINVPNNVSYVALSIGDVFELNGEHERKIDTDIINDITSIKSQFNECIPSLVFSNMANGYLNSSGEMVSTEDTSYFRVFLYNVEEGQIFYFKQNISSPYAYYGFSDDVNISHIISYNSSQNNEFVRIVVPNGAHYFIVNGMTQTTGTIPDTVSFLGIPKLNLDGLNYKVYNYFPAYSLNRLDGTLLSNSQVKIDESFISVGASKYMELDASSSMQLIFEVVNKDFRSQLKTNGKIRICFDCVCNQNSFSLRLYTWGGSQGYYEKNFSVVIGQIEHIDTIIDIPVSDFNNITNFDLYITNSTNLIVKIANLIVTDDIYDATPIPYFSNDWLPSTIRKIPYLYKTCLYIGDSISTSNNYQWKGIIEDDYSIKYVRDKNNVLNPADGGITIRPSMADESSLPDANKSIWYRCANARMSNFEFDIINLLGGQNDKSVIASGLLGTIDDKPYVDDASNFDTPSNYTDVWSNSLTFAQCYMGCIEMLKRDFPNKELLLMSIYPTGDIANAEDMAILQCEIAYKYGLKMTPLYWSIFANSAVPAFTSDGVHPNSVLARQMAISFAQTLGI